ncbi:hypothetical protein V1511DRAFT_100615 [Dipodascopsis uninucleata]
MASAPLVITSPASSHFQHVEPVLQRGILKTNIANQNLINQNSNIVQKLDETKNKKVVENNSNHVNNAGPFDTKQVQVNCISTKTSNTEDFQDIIGESFSLNINCGQDAYIDNDLDIPLTLQGIDPKQALGKTSTLKLTSSIGPSSISLSAAYMEEHMRDFQRYKDEATSIATQTRSSLMQTRSMSATLKRLQQRFRRLTINRKNVGIIGMTAVNESAQMQRPGENANAARFPSIHPLSDIKNELRLQYGVPASVETLSVSRTDRKRHRHISSITRFYNKIFKSPVPLDLEQ